MMTKRMFMGLLSGVLCAGLATAEPEPTPKETKGELTGKIIKKDGPRITVKGEGGELKLIPHWRGGMPKDGGGFDKAMVERLKKFDVGDQVRVKWTFTEHYRIEAIDHVDARR